jgi:hypothetical protein
VNVEDVIARQLGTSFSLTRTEKKLMSQIMDAEGVARPTPGRIVWYQTDGRNGLDYFLPAMVTVTRASHPGDYPDGKPNSLPVPSSDLHVHLTVFTPGGFGSVYRSDEGEQGWSDYQQEDLENLGRPAEFTPGSGSYVEWDVPYDPNGARRSWRWPEREG